MPELPEVETIAGYLRDGYGAAASILGQKVARVLLLNEKTLANVTEEQVDAILSGQKVTRVGRRGKFLRVMFERDQLVIHLRMSGDIRIDTHPGSIDWLKHDRLAVLFDNGPRMILNDTRKFARCWVLGVNEEIPAKLGLEPLSEEFTPAALRQLLHQRKRAIKPVLLDQSLIAGIGNIYSDEALFMAGIDPRRPACTLSAEESEKLWQAIRNVLELGIRTHGASIDWVYRGGDFQNYFNVYHHKGDPCPNCGHPVERMVLGQRGTHYCPNCQK